MGGCPWIANRNLEASRIHAIQTADLRGQYHRENEASLYLHRSLLLIISTPSKRFHRGRGRMVSDGQTIHYSVGSSPRGYMPKAHRPKLSTGHAEHTSEWSILSDIRAGGKKDSELLPLFETGGFNRRTAEAVIKDLEKSKSSVDVSVSVHRLAVLASSRKLFNSWQELLHWIVCNQVTGLKHSRKTGCVPRHEYTKLYNSHILILQSSWK